MRRERKGVFDSWLTENYERLLVIAKRYVTEPEDLLHHVYLRVLNADPPRLMDNPLGYFHRAMYFEATRGQYKRLMKCSEELTHDPPFEQDFEKLVRAEQLQVWAFESWQSYPPSILAKDYRTICKTSI